MRILLALLLALPILAGDTLTLENAELRITWRNRDAAIEQVEWRADHTRFFQGPGPGAAAGTFAGEPVVADTPGGREITFTGTGGARVVYRLPAQGHVLELVAASVPLELLPAQAAGRVFTLEDRRIHAVAWADLVKEPFFGFLGARRKDLPPATARLGMDAGPFAAIWHLASPPLRGPGGYLLPPGGAGRLYLGPRQESALEAFGKPFTQVLDYGFFGPLGRALYLGLNLLHAALPNWGWALVVFSALLRLLLWPLNTKSVVQALRTRDLEPHVKALQARRKDAGGTRAEQQQEVMAFYKRNGHNPMGGCLTALIQMPVFLALYSMLGNVFELRNAPWMFWIRDLSGKDPYFVLPILLCVGMFAQQAAAPPAGDPAQRRMMLVVMPLMMLFMFASLPAGLNLYYLVFNGVGMIQTWWVTRTYQSRPVVAIDMQSR